MAYTYIQKVLPMLAFQVHVLFLQKKNILLKINLDWFHFYNAANAV